MASRNQEHAIAALRSAGFHDAASLLGSMNTPPDPSGAPVVKQPTTPADREAAEFVRQIQDATDKSGWVSTPLNTPIDDGGRF